MKQITEDDFYGIGEDGDRWYLHESGNVACGETASEANVTAARVFHFTTRDKSNIPSIVGTFGLKKA